MSSDLPTREGKLREYISKDALYLMGIPSSYQCKFLGDYHFVKPEFKEMVTRYVNNPQDMLRDCINLLFLGTNGAGKTFLATIILQELYIRYYSGYYITFSEIIRKTYNKEDVADIYNSEFLVIDELGAEVNTERGSEKALLESVLKARDREGKPTIICTNLKKEELTVRYGYTVDSMLNMFIKATFTTKDGRGEAFKNKEAIKKLLKG